MGDVYFAFSIRVDARHAVYDKAADIFEGERPIGNILRLAMAADGFRAFVIFKVRADADDVVFLFDDQAFAEFFFAEAMRNVFEAFRFAAKNVYVPRVFGARSAA